MPRFGKEALSRFVATGCHKQLFSNLFPPRQNPQAQQERLVRGIPRIQTPRPGLAHYREAGYKYEAAKFSDLVGAFGQQAMCGDPHEVDGVLRYREIVLLPRLQDPDLQAGRFLIEARFDPDAPGIRQRLGAQDIWAPVPGGAPAQRLHLAVLRPDIIQVCPPGTHPMLACPDGEVSAAESGDDRLQLRIIDVKLTSEPSAGYFAQVVYYTMALAAFLEHHHLAHRFAVAAASAIWPGSHAASNLRQETECQLATGVHPDHAALLAALEADLEPAPHSVFAYRIRKILRQEVPEVLQTAVWANQPWHVDASCAGCPYLGHPRPNATGDAVPDAHHCMPTAATADHLSRIAFLSPAARESLESANVSTVGQLASLNPQNAAFGAHPTLRAGRIILPARAGALLSNAAVLPDQGATSALLPKWADLRVYVTAHFDSTSALTTVLGWQSFSTVPRGYNIAYPDDTAGQALAPRRPPAILTQARSLDAERDALLEFLHGIDELLTDTQAADQARRAWCDSEHAGLHPDPSRAHPDTKVQFYIWDQLQYDHIARVVGRHLPFILADQTLRKLAWLFPPEEVLQNPRLIGYERVAPFAPPVSIVREVIRSLIAAPTPHWYGLLDVARAYQPPGLPGNMGAFAVPELFQGEFSDQIPSERAFDLWTGSHPNEAAFQWIARTHLDALAAVTRRATTDLDQRLRSVAHPISMLGSIPRESRLSVDAQLWFAFSKLDAALDGLEKRELRSLPQHEREARFVSARLVSRLTGAEADQVLASNGLQPRQGRLVYRLGPGSVHIKVRPGDQGYALAPSDDPAFLDRSFDSAAPQVAASYGALRYRRMDELTSVTVAAIDRDAGHIVVDHSFPLGLIDALEAAGENFSTEVMLDPRPSDHFTKPLKASLAAIGNPAVAGTSPLIQQVRNATGQIQGSSNLSPRRPAADFLWDAQATYESASAWADAVTGLREELVGLGVDLNESQWQAWEEVLTHRLRLVWGPPGTGKTKLAAAIILGAMLAAGRLRHAIRILVCATTYTALDNVLRELFALPLPDVTIRRLRSSSQPRSEAQDDWPHEADLVTSADEAEALRYQLADASTTVVVAATPQQIARLINVEGTESTEELFDLGLVDEASQMDVAHATLPLCSMAEGSALVMIGDPKQLPPIHKATPPAGLEAMVGSIYGYLTSIGHVPGDLMLNRNYRSNQTIVDFARFAGYLPGLESDDPGRVMPLAMQLPAAAPPGWPAEWLWSDDFADYLDPLKPTVAIVHADRLSSQWSDAEAETVAVLVWLLRSCLGTSTQDGLVVPYADGEFWAKGVGVVTPHRAQQGLITSRLQTLFPGAARSAVDTVERFQGQQREVIIASFAIGDVDAIRNEEEFLYSLERFNVMASRARSKLIVLLSWGVLDHLADKPELLRASELLKRYVYTFCNMEQSSTILGPAGQSPALFRWHPQQ
jgi:hypothetical protein